MSFTSTLLTRIDYNTELIRKEFGGLDKETFNARPDANSWSVAQCIDHLYTVNASYFEPLEQVLNGEYKRHWMSRVGFMVNFFGKMILNSVQPRRRKKLRTFGIWEPEQSALGTELIEQFAEQQEELKKLIAASEELINAGQVISSPANRTIVYRLATACEIIVAHEERHIVQAREALQQVQEAQKHQ